MLDFATPDCHQTMYHRGLRVALVVVGCMLAFQSGIFHAPTGEWSIQAQQYVATAVGVQASVPPTELNRYTAGLSAWEQDLAAREAAVAEREIQLRRTDPATSTQYSTFILSAILFIILVLIVLNYVLDFLRARESMNTVLVTSSLP